MIKIKDGRTELYQWDTGSILTVGEGIDEVHFARSPMGRSITAPVANGEAKVEDVLLQTAGKLFVWGFVGTAEDGYTKLEREFTVRARNKPADYVFTPPEQITLSEILEDLKRVQDVVTPEAVGALVEEYLRENPVDGAVQIDATLTKEGFAADAAAVGHEVNQLSEAIADKLDADKLPEAINTALEQAKASGEFDGEPGEKGNTGDKGDKGDKGDPGEPGQKGDKGDQGIQGAQGEQGPKGDKGDKGDTGADGANGKTPVKGTDYWTAADKSAMVSDVLAALPTWNGGSY